VSEQLALSPKQLLSLKESDGRINVWEGSVRSGKTIASLLRWLMYVNTSRQRGELLVVSRTRASAARNVFSPLQDPSLFGSIARAVHYTPGADTATILGRKVWVLGSSDIRSENVLRGLTCAGAYVDEITLLREDFWTQLLNRLWESAKLFGTTNPDNPAHWLKLKFLDRLNELPDWRSWHFLLDDNPALSEERKAAIRRENTGLFYKRNVLGLWVPAEGAVFESWEPSRHVVPYDESPLMQQLLALGIDYGATNPTAAILLGLGVDGRLWALDEWRRSRRRDAGASRTTIDEVVQDMQAWLGDRVPRFVPVDPSAAELKIQLARAGVRGVMDADNEVVYGVRILASLLTADKLRVTDRCPGLITEMPGYSWDDKAAEKGLDKPMKQADHSIDGLRYGAISTETLWRPYIHT